MENKDKAAFSVALMDNGNANHPEAKGLTKLEYFTAMAMQGLISNVQPGHSYSPTEIAIISIDCAKETLNQLEKEK